MGLEWKNLNVEGHVLKTTYRAHYKGWACTMYTLPPVSFMAHIGASVIRAKTEKELLTAIDKL